MSRESDKQLAGARRIIESLTPKGASKPPVAKSKLGLANIVKRIEGITINSPKASKNDKSNTDRVRSSIGEQKIREDGGKGHKSGKSGSVLMKVLMSLKEKNEAKDKKVISPKSALMKKKIRLETISLNNSTDPPLVSSIPRESINTNISIDFSEPVAVEGPISTLPNSPGLKYSQIEISLPRGENSKDTHHVNDSGLGERVYPVEEEPNPAKESNQFDNVENRLDIVRIFTNKNIDRQGFDQCLLSSFHSHPHSTLEGLWAVRAQMDCLQDRLTEIENMMMFYRAIARKMVDPTTIKLPPEDILRTEHTDPDA